MGGLQDTFHPRECTPCWPRVNGGDGMYKDVHAHCRRCLTCGSYQGTGRRVRPPLMPIPVGGLFYRVGMDIMELPQTVNGNCYVISFVDYLTKWVGLSLSLG